MFTGTVKWFNNTKGFGFVVPDLQTTDCDGHKTQLVKARDVFAHYSEINMEGYKALKAGQLVAFDIKTGDKGEQAINIRPVVNTDANTNSEAKTDLTTTDADTQCNASIANTDIPLTSEVAPA